MIDFHFWTTPNGYKVFLFLEESGVPYRLKPVNISKGEQFAPEFLAISPNNRIPAIVDHSPREGGGPIAIFESGAILLYLAEKFARFIPTDPRGRAEVLQWLFWQMAGLGPMAGQSMHFLCYAPDVLRYAITRYGNETSRLFKVLDKRLADREFIAGDYSIADMACYPWIAVHERLHQDLSEFPNLRSWHDCIRSRPAIIRAYDKGRAVNTTPTVIEESKKFLLGQSARTLAA